MLFLAGLYDEFFLVLRFSALFALVLRVGVFVRTLGARVGLPLLFVSVFLAGVVLITRVGLCVLVLLLLTFCWVLVSPLRVSTLGVLVLFTASLLVFSLIVPLPLIIERLVLS